MKTTTAIKRVKSEIDQKKINIKRLARDYINIPTKSTEKEKSIFKRMKAEKKEKNRLEHLVKRMSNRKKTMPNMVWKKGKSLEDNILSNLDKK